MSFRAKVQLVLLLDGEGRAVAPALIAPDATGLPGRTPVSEATLATFAAKLPHRAAQGAHLV